MMGGLTRGTNMARRKSMYYVGGEHPKKLYSMANWVKIALALEVLNQNTGEVYRLGGKNEYTGVCDCYVQKAMSGEYFTQSELDAFYWFFLGVLHAHNITELAGDE